MPSKAELKQEIDTLRASLKETTKRLSEVKSNSIITGYRHGASKGEIGAGTFYSLAKPELADEIEYKETKLKLKNVLELSDAEVRPFAGLPAESLARKWFPGHKFLTEEASSEELEDEQIWIDKAVATEARRRGYDAIRYGSYELQVLNGEIKSTKRLTALESNPGNPELLPSGERARLPAPKCDLYISKIESEIAAGKSYWDTAEEQYNRWIAGEDRCLPCEREYVEAKESLIEIGDRYRSLIRPEDAKIEAIAESLREDSTRELYKAEAHIKTASASCNIKFPRVRSRLLKMKPLAHVGRWGEFMDNQKQLMSDLEQDVRETIPDIKVRAPSYAVPRYVKEVEKIVPRKPTPEEEKEIEETRRLAALGRKARGGA